MANFMVSLMLRNFATDTWHFTTTTGDRTIQSQPGCMIASPSRPRDPETDQDYVHHWLRDAAICFQTLVGSELPFDEIIRDHATFSKATQDAARGSGLRVGHAAYRINAEVRPWSEQSDGPALRILSLLAATKVLDRKNDTIVQVVKTDLNYLLQVYDQKTHNLWEETNGFSFFARSVQKRALEALKAEQPTWIGDNATAVDHAISILGTTLEQHWTDDNGGYYRSVLQPESGSRGANVNIDVVMGAIYGERPALDERMLRSAAVVRSVFENLYPINANDAQQGCGPMMGRYPEDTYDGDVSEGPNEGHPWPLATAVFAEFYYRVTQELKATSSFEISDTMAPFFDQIGFGGRGTVTRGTQVHQELMDALVEAGDKMMRAVIHHSTYLELSEQNDRYSGFSKSVRNLSWSYAAFISAARMRKSVVGHRVH